MTIKRFLIIDDSKLARMLFTGAAKEVVPDAQIAEVDSGEKAVAYVAANEVDLVVCDLNMPGMDGFEVIAKLRELRPELTIVMLSANIQSAVQQRAGDQGVRFIEKPINAAKLRDVLAALG